MCSFRYPHEILVPCIPCLGTKKPISVETVSTHLKLYLNKGVYGFLMKPVFTETPSSRSKHYAVLADYACSREGTDVFFFLKRKIVYGGKIYGNKDAGSFYLNGENSPLGKKAKAPLFWDESSRC